MRSTLMWAMTLAQACLSKENLQFLIFSIGHHHLLLRSQEVFFLLSNLTPFCLFQFHQVIICQLEMQQVIQQQEASKLLSNLSSHQFLQVMDYFEIELKQQQPCLP